MKCRTIVSLVAHKIPSVARVIDAGRFGFCANITNKMERINPENINKVISNLKIFKTLFSSKKIIPSLSIIKIYQQISSEMSID